jgi:hypothetical protein
MKKSDLLHFIELYNLSGAVEKVKIDADGTDLKTTFITEDKTLYGTVHYRGLAMEKGEYAFHDTAQFKKMLSPLEEDISVSVERVNDRPIGLTFSDDNVDSAMMLADLSVVPKAPKGVAPGNADFEFTIDEEFINRFITAKNALGKDVTSFTLLFNPKTNKTELIIGYSNINTNRIRLEIKPVAGKEKIEKQVSFNADYLKEILSKNPITGTTTCKVNSAGLAHLQFNTVAYDANYYLLKVSSI